MPKAHFTRAVRFTCEAYFTFRGSGTLRAKNPTFVYPTNVGFFVVREAGVEPARPEWTLEPESSESANSTTRAYVLLDCSDNISYRCALVNPFFASCKIFSQKAGPSGGCRADTYVHRPRSGRQCRRTGLYKIGSACTGVPSGRALRSDYDRRIVGHAPARGTPHP